MPIDPVAAALDAVAAHFASFDGIAAGKRGWPDHPEDLDLAGDSVVTVTAVRRTATLSIPDEVDRDPDGDELLVTYRVGFLEVEAQLDLWSNYRAKRDDGAAVVEAGFHNRLPWKSGLELTSTGYFDRPLTVDAHDGRPMDDPGTVAEGEWRQRWSLRIRTDLVAQAASPQQAPIRFETTTDLGDDTVVGTTDLTP